MRKLLLLALFLIPTLSHAQLNCSGGCSSFTSPLSVSLGTITADAQNITGTATWNSAGTTFTMNKYTVTDTASAAGSKFFEYLVGATSEASLTKGGNLTVKGNINYGDGTVSSPSLAFSSASTGLFFSGGLGISIAGNLRAQWTSTRLQLDSNYTLGFGGFGSDTGVSRISAGVLGIGNGTNLDVSGGLSMATLAVTGATTLATSLTGVLRADSGVVSVDSSAGDINKRMTADATNATATMSNLTNLSVTLTAGVHYVGLIQIFGVDSTNTDGLQFDLGGGSATFTDLEFGFAAQPTGSTLGTVTSTASTTPITLTVVSTSDASYPISFGFTVNAGGTFIPRFSQVAHSTGTATVRKNSNLVIMQSTN